MFIQMEMVMREEEVNGKKYEYRLVIYFFCFFLLINYIKAYELFSLNKNDETNDIIKTD